MTRVASASTPPGLGHLDGIIAKVGQAQIFEQHAAVGVRIGAHAPLAFRRQRGHLSFESAILIEQLLGLVALHPLFENLYVRGIFMHLAHRYLVRAPVTFGALAIDLLGTSPAFGRAQTRSSASAAGLTFPLPASAHSV